MSTVNQEHMDALLRLVNKGPYFQLLNMEARDLPIKYCEGEMRR